MKTSISSTQKKITNVISIIIIMALVVTSLGIIAPDTVSAAGSDDREYLKKLRKTASSREGAYSAGYHANSDYTYHYATQSNNLGIVTADITKKRFYVDVYSPANYKKLSSKTISFGENTVWGTFYAAPDGYFYVLLGRNNPKESKTKVVMEVKKYSIDWNYIASAYMYGSATQGFYGGVTIPFDAGAPSMTLAGNELVVHTSREMFQSSDGKNHQSNLTFDVDTATMTATPHYSFDLYVSHSFNQFVVRAENDLVYIDHGDAYPRSIRLKVNEDFAAGTGSFDSFTLMKITGNTGQNYTGTTLNGAVSYGKNVVVVGHSVPHNNAVKGKTGLNFNSRNVYISTFNTETRATNFKWLTNYNPSGKTRTGQPRIVSVGEDRFAILYSIETKGKYKMVYKLIDSQGNVLATKAWNNRYYSASSDPILINNQLFFTGYQTDGLTTYLSKIDMNNLTNPTLTLKKSSNAYLKSIKVKSGKLSKRFKKKSYKYTVKASAGKTVKITVNPSFNKATVKIKVGKGKWKKTKSVKVKASSKKSKTVYIKVIAQNNKTKKTYKLKV